MNRLKVGDYIRYLIDNDVGEIIDITDFHDKFLCKIEWLKTNDGIGRLFLDDLESHPETFTIIPMESERERLQFRLKYL